MCEMSCKVSRLLQKIYLQVCTKRYLTLWALFQSRKDNLFTGAFLALFRFSSVLQEGTVKMCLWIAFECGCVLQQNMTRSVASRPEICAVNKTKQTNKQLMRIFKCLRLCASEVQFISHLTHLQLCIFLKSRIIFHLKKPKTHVATESSLGNLSNLFISPTEFWGGLCISSFYTSRVQYHKFVLWVSSPHFPLFVPC